MIYLSGGIPAGLRALAHTAPVGLMVQPGNNLIAQVDRFAHWGADNGCYAKGDSFDLAGYYQYLDRPTAEVRARCLFATAPDVVGDAAATWVRSCYILPDLRALGYPAALVAQDGIRAADLDWDAFDALFVGGSTQFKYQESTTALVREARSRGKWCHLGRVNTQNRIRWARWVGYDSLDGTKLAIEPGALRRVLGWVVKANRQATLFQ